MSLPLTENLPRKSSIITHLMTHTSWKKDDCCKECHHERVKSSQSTKAIRNECMENYDGKVGGGGGIKKGFRGEMVLLGELRCDTGVLAWVHPMVSPCNALEAREPSLTRQTGPSDLVP